MNGNLMVDKGREREDGIQDREERLVAVNALLAERHLKPRGKLGLASENEQEILGIYHIDDRTPQFHTTIYYAVLLKDGRVIELPVRYNANGDKCDGVVFVILLNGTHLVLVKEWRHSLAEWVTGIPRGFTELEDVMQMPQGGPIGNPADLKIPALRVLFRELGEEVGDPSTLALTQIAFLGKVYQNTGTDSAAPDYVLLSLRGPTNFKSTPKDPDHKVRVWSVEQVREAIGGELNDSHTLTALVLLERFARSLSGAPAGRFL